MWYISGGDDIHYWNVQDGWVVGENAATIYTERVSHCPRVMSPYGDPEWQQATKETENV